MILGLDLATSTGFCYGDGASLPVVGTCRMPQTGEEVGPFLFHFETWLEETIEAVRPTMIIFEAPIIRSDGSHIMTVRKLTGLAALVELVAHKRGVEVLETHISTVKRTLTGKGNAEKHEMIFFARKAGIVISAGFEGQDEADAFGVWVSAVLLHTKHAGRWRPLIGSGSLL